MSKVISLSRAPTGTRHDFAPVGLQWNLGPKLGPTNRSFSVCFSNLFPNPPDHALPGTGNARLSLGVTDIGQATHELKARGVATTPVKEEPGGLLSYFKDPDGNELCLWQGV